MNRYLENNRGITLVELLAVIVIGSIIILLISNVHLFGQKQYKEQSKKATGLHDVSYAAKVITREIRKADEKNVENIGVNRDHIKLAEDIEFKYNVENKSIELKDGTVLVNDIEKFFIELQDNKVRIEMKSFSNKIVETEIILRRGG